MQTWDSVLVEDAAGTVRTRWSTPWEAIEQLREDCEYDPEEDCPLDDLIAYKDALEDFTYQLLDQLGREQSAS